MGSMSEAASGLPGGLAQVRAPEELIEIGRRRSTRRAAGEAWRGWGDSEGRCKCIYFLGRGFSCYWVRQPPHHAKVPPAGTRQAGAMGRPGLQP